MSQFQKNRKVFKREEKYDPPIHLNKPAAEPEIKLKVFLLLLDNGIYGI